MNILFTSVGRRGYLLEYFREALAGKGLIHAANSDAQAPAFFYADKVVITPLIYSENYIDFIFNYCEKEQIDAVIPLFDIDIPIFSAFASKFNEAVIKVIVPSLDKAVICNDKLKSSKFLSSNGFLTPDTFTSVDEVCYLLNEQKIKFPLIIKPRWGMGSIGIHIAHDLNELKVLYAIVQRSVLESYLKYESAVEINEAVIIQVMLPGQEYGLDVINDLEGNYITTFVKKKLAMRAGETDVAAIEIDEDLIEVGEKLGKIISHLGILDVDVFRDKKDIYILELNARFGGGYPFSHLAGANIPRAIVSWLMGSKLEPEWLSVIDNTTGFKCLNVKEMRWKCD